MLGEGGLHPEKSKPTHLLWALYFLKVYCTNFCIQQKGAARKGSLVGSHKYLGKSALRYKLGADILAGNLV